MPKLNLVPRERRFNGLFSRQGQLVSEALAELGGSLNDELSRHAIMRELEHKCDDVTHEIYNLTNRTFVPPFERADILMLAHSLDEIVDLAEETADKIDLYHVESITDAAKSMGRCLAEAGSQIASAAERDDPRRGHRHLGRQYLGPLVAEIDADLAHHVNHLAVDTLRGPRACRLHIDAAIRHALEECCSDLTAAGILNAYK